jgi:hypothetical protein
MGMMVHQALSVGLLLFALGCGGRRDNPVGKANPIASIEASTAVLKKVRPAQNGVPDAVLNLTKCLVVIPQATTQVREGTTACREAHDRWLVPRSASLGLRPGAAGPIGDVLIFVIGEKAMRSLGSGQLFLDAANEGPGPTVHDNVTITDVDLQHDALVYHLVGNKLEGSRLEGEIRLGAAAPQSTAFTETVT